MANCDQTPAYKESGKYVLAKLQPDATFAVEMEADKVTYKDVIPTYTKAFKQAVRYLKGSDDPEVRIFETVTEKIWRVTVQDRNREKNLSRNVYLSDGGCGCERLGNPIKKFAKPLMIKIPGCLCTDVPSVVSLTVTYGIGEDTHTYSNAYRNCTIAWYTAEIAQSNPQDSSTIYVKSGAIPGYMPPGAFSGSGYYSTTSWVDDQGFTDYFRLTCYSTQWALSMGQNNQGLWLAPGQIYNWNMGGRPPVNYCFVQDNPFFTEQKFELLVGRPQPGIYFNGRFQVVG